MKYFLLIALFFGSTASFADQCVVAFRYDSGGFGGEGDSLAQMYKRKFKRQFKKNGVTVVRKETNSNVGIQISARLIETVVGNVDHGGFGTTPQVKTEHGYTISAKKDGIDAFSGTYKSDTIPEVASQTLKALGCI